MAAKRYTLIFYAALVVAVLATFGVYRVLEASKQSNRVATVPVVVAAKDIAEGVLIDRVGVVVAQWPAGTQPAGAYGTVDSVVGRVPRVVIFKGEALVPGRLAPEGTGAGLEVKITPGKRAYGIRVNDVATLAGMVQPNSRVDIMVVVDDPNEGGTRTAKLFMSNMRVLAIGTAAQRAEDGRPVNAGVASIEVTPEEAERLAIATTTGQIQLVLRGYGDPDTVNTKGANAADITRGLRNAPTVRLPRPEPRRQSAPRPSAPTPAPVQQAPVVPPPPAAKPETLSVKIFRGTKEAESARFQKDSAKRDSTARRP
jgi:pilus assembly protein CpaB